MMKYNTVQHARCCCTGFTVVKKTWWIDCLFKLN